MSDMSSKVIGGKNYTSFVDDGHWVAEEGPWQGVLCGKCENDTFRLEYEKDAYNIEATCTACGLKASVYSG